MKLVLVGQAKCKPCKAMKEQIELRIKELEGIGATFEYIDLNELDDKETFIEMHNLMSTPTAWVDFGRITSNSFSGYVDIDTLFDFVRECKTFVEVQK